MLEASQHDGVTRLRGSTRASRAIDYEVSAYVVRGVLIDSGFPAIGAEFGRWLDGARLEGALITHYHEDHAGNVGRIIARGLPVGMSPETLARIRLPKPIGLYRRICWGSPAPLARDPEPFAHAGLSLIATPGHTTDHQVVWDAERETVFGGDLFIGVKVRIAHPGEDIRAQPVALRKVAALAPKHFFDAHRGPVERPVEALLAKAQWIDDVIGAIERLADDGCSVRAIERAVLGSGDLTGWISRGDYSRRNLVASVLASRSGGPAEDDRPTVSARRQ
jgi:glyoxylase-like metal-dependent hydrolase (beta-lactamase superfamily II)